MAVERPDWQWYQRAVDLVAAGDLDGAERAAADALDDGHLWRISLLLAPALDPLRGRPEFERVAAEARRRVEARHLTPVVLTATPAHGRDVNPLLLVLHGATGSASAELERWRVGTELGFIVAAAQSSQPATDDGFCWDPPRERIWQDLRAIAVQLPAHARIVLAGFSQGAWVALNAALRADLFPAQAVLMFGPFVGSLENLERSARRLKVVVTLGQEDGFGGDVERLVEGLRERGHHVWLDVVPNLAHAYPPDFAERLRQAIATTSSRSSSQ